MTATLPTQNRNYQPGEIGRGVAAALALLVFVVGTPVALVALAPVYVPAATRTWERVGDLLTSPDDGSLLLAVLGATAWVAWLVFTLSVVVELIAGARRVVAPRLPMIGGVQNTAARLVATAGILLAVSSTLVAHAQPAQASTTITLEHPMNTSSEPVSDPGDGAEPPASQPVAPPADVLPHVTVQRGDTLWSIAEHHLGAGTRYTEIRDLNINRPQPGGGSLIEADWIMPGWQLLLPADATGTEPPSAGASAAPGTVTVLPGDTLWQIAAEHLGAGDRYPEIVDLNRDQVQPDGDTLRDPDLIRPGWVLLLPTDGTVATPTEEEVSAPPPTTAPAELQDDHIPATAQNAIAPSDPDRSERSTGAQDAASMPTAEAHASAPDPSNVADEPDVDPHTDSPATWFLGLTALGAAGLIGEVTRRRHLQQRARRLGESIPMPDLTSPAAHAERTLRSASTPVSIPAITTTLDNLGCRCFDAGRELPRVGALLLDEHTLTLLLLEDDPEPIAPFTAADPHTWVASTADVAAETAIDDPERCAPYPLLVTLGHTEHGTLIVNLEAAGTLTITGDDTIADDILRALVVEAATSDLSGQLCVCLDPADDLAPLASAFEPHRLRLLWADDERATTTTAVAQSLSSQGLEDTLQARGDRQAPDTWLPVTFVERTVAGTGCAPWTGVGLVSRQDSDDRAGWTIEADDRSVAVLRPLDVAFQPQRLRHDQLNDVQALLDTSVPPTPNIAAPRPIFSSKEEIAALRAAHSDTAEPAPAERSFTIGVLGPIEIDGPPSTRRLSPRMTELLVYLALHGPTTGADLDDVLWNGARINAGTRNALIYRARRHVGANVLPLADKDGCYRLGDGATTDWHQFQHALADGEQSDGRSEIDRLRHALDLVRDRPFRGIRGAEYAWADYDIQRMTGAIADTAAVLANLQLRAGNERDALDTALHGMRVAPYSEALQGIALEAARATGGVDEEARLRARFSALLGELDPELSG
ncbi:LysM peptidoglycan-binding domain-containing protein [Cellulomonas sp.]|uniref:LysM peptidoglycan-binding domain-containing protein n=1 Tax=Cellulomonas sp. TaxID=40001 RepID=UPI003BA8BF6D